MADRANKLNKYLKDVIDGRNVVTTLTHRDRFVEALCARDDVIACLTQLSNSKQGLSTLQKIMRFDLSDAFFASDVLVNVLTYLQAPGTDIEGIDSGKFLHGLVTAIVDPPIFWTPFIEAFKDGKLSVKAQICFAWILLQLILLSDKPTSIYHAIAEDPQITDALLKSSDLDLRTYGQKLKAAVSTPDTRGTYRPGGRHDNDFPDYREISILPTADEVLSQEISYMRCRADLDDPETLETRVPMYLDNQFRLLREDMLSEIKEEIQIGMGKKKGKNRGFSAKGLKLVDIHCQSGGRRSDKWGILMKLAEDLPQMKHQHLKKPDARKDFLKKNRKLIAHQSTTCLFADGNIIGFASINRDEDLLSQNPPVLLLHPQGSDTMVEGMLAKLQLGKVLSIMQINTAVFAFEPILKAIRNMRDVPLKQELLFWDDSATVTPPPETVTDFLRFFTADPSRDLKDMLKLSKTIRLDKSQGRSLLAGLSQRVAIIQGPPGTGKSFIGALLAKVIHDFTSQSILVVCYTNHALDQFLEDLLDTGIPLDAMVRLGGKSTSRTEPMSLFKQNSMHKMLRSDYHKLDELRRTLAEADSDLKAAFERYKQSKVSLKDLMNYIEFDDSDYYDAFLVPVANDGTVLVGKNGRAIHDMYLLERWIRGENAGLLMHASHVKAASTIWTMSPLARFQKRDQWEQSILQERVSEVVRHAKLFNSTLEKIDDVFGKKDITILGDKRIIGCTTTAAAKYASILQAAAPGVLLVEEAGEILESHVLTALGRKKDQLILIGDHKQLRPKVNNYALTVEKGDGFDLNMSLFERLVIKGYPHETLSQQHRMRPEISRLVRELTYPDLMDEPSTLNRPDIRGLRNNVILIDHSHPEDDMPDTPDRLATSSKQNTHEVDLVVQIVRYLAQQGYGTDSMVVLTPYLGQLSNFSRRMKNDMDPILNDLDSYDLVRAGLVTPASAKLRKSSLRLATIDNYQGEEANIVIISLTRSNPNHDIGFMFSPERLNVLLSRARDGLIIVGNTNTFSSSKKGGELWGKLFGLLREGGHVYEGLPVKCERHPSRIATLAAPKDFEEQCPDGGCSQSCGTMLICGIHECPSKCHQLVDHSKMKCEQVTSSQCDKGHARSYKCFEGPPANCKKCDLEAKRKAQKDRREYATKKQREDEQLAHTQRMADIEAKIEEEHQKIRDERLAEERLEAIRQKEAELEAAKQHAASRRATLVSSISDGLSRLAQSVRPLLPSQTESTTPTDVPSPPTAPSPPVPTPLIVPTPPPIPPKLPLRLASVAQPSVESVSEQEWNRQKNIEGAMNDAIDSLMQMTGLEEVKAQVLRIKSKIDLANRQNVPTKNERFHVVLQGNPGTGKTTVARLYAKFLTSVGVLEGNQFIETTGSRLSNDGVDGVKKTIEDLLKNGGGTMFIDEAYQLTSGSNYGGPQVLDFLLAEMENNVGKIVFLFAGYRKEMEKFFEHNPGLPSRIPYSMSFEDYTDEELLTMLERMIKKHWAGRMQVEDGPRGLYCRIAVRRLGSGRGREGFGNARALANIFDKIRERQADRLQKSKRQGHRVSDYELLGVDIIGPDPVTVLKESPAYKKLKELTGLGSVKQSVDGLFSTINTNYQRELQEKKPIAVSLNRVFLGSPGTGKTTVAKLYGEILSGMGLLSNGEVVVKNPADFVGSVLGQSEANTKAILATTVGKILVIDEAYMLYSKSGGSVDPYKTAVIDTIVAEVQSVPGEDRCVLMLGYKEQMEEMFQNVNPGLARRFAIENAFTFQDFTDSELLDIMNLKLKQQDLSATDEAKKVAIGVLNRARNRPNFGNAGEVENMLSLAKGRYQTRTKGQGAVDIVFQPQDFDPDFDRSSKAGSNLQELFKDVVGSENIVSRLTDFQRMTESAKARGVDPRELIPTTFVFKGPPGTGKTTVARKMGQVYYDMGFLSSTEVVECSASDLVGEYVGHTGPKTKKLFEKALGRVLFVDEAYRLGEGHFAQEAMDELVGILTQERFKGKIIVILAGYDEEMDRLLGVNPGLASRFPDQVTFEDLKPVHALKLLENDLIKNGVRLADLQDVDSDGYAQLKGLLEDLAILPSWGNARDIKTLAKKITQWVFANYSTSPSSSTSKEIDLSLDHAVTIVEEMLQERRKQDSNVNSLPKPLLSSLPVQTQNAQPPPRPTTTTTTTQKVKAETKREGNGPQKQPPPKAQAEPPAQRDPGASDEQWQQLQVAKAVAERVEKEAQAAIEKMQKARVAAKRREETLRREVERLQREQAAAKEEAKRKELQKKLEQERLKALKAKEDRERKERELEEKRRLERVRQAEERKAQEKLRAMGACVAGYQWIPQNGGWRCAGGSHYVSRAQLGM